MTSSVYFKFKSQKEPTRVEFDGTGISVFELKRDIILKSGLGDGTDFDLAIYSDDGKDEYDDDTTIIPRSTTVVARRLPPLKPGAGRAARYVSGKMPANAKNASRREQVAKATAKATSNAISQMNNAQTEDEKIAAMFAAQSEQWSAQQEDLSQHAPAFKPGMSKRPVNVPDHPPPTGYICYRCGEKGHWIQLCPTNNDPEFDNRPRVKRTTGIPRSFLKTVDKAAILAQAAEDDTKAPSGIMVNADGDFVIAEPDKVAWEKFQAKTKQGAAAKEVAALADKELQERGLECPLDKKLFIEPMKTPCCEKTYCNDCITNALIESDFVCPGCSTEGVLIDDLKPDEVTEKKITEYQAEKRDKAKAKEESKSPLAEVKSPPAEKAKADVKAEASDTEKPKSPLTPKSVASPPKEAAENNAVVKTEQTTVANDAQNSKKRPAEDPAENPRIPKAPKAMQKQQEAQEQQQMMQQMMNGMPGMPGMMPFPMGMPNMPNMNGMPGFGMGMPNMNMPGFGMGMPNMPNMNMPGMPGMNMGMMNPMMNPMMGMNGFNGMNGMNGGGFGGPGGQMGGPNQQGWGGMNGQGGNMGGGRGNMGMNGGMMNGGGFNGHNNNGPGGNFNQNGGGEDDAYFRKPVNPHRHQNRQKRVRPSDFTELGQ